MGDFGCGDMIEVNLHGMFIQGGLVEEMRSLVHGTKKFKSSLDALIKVRIKLSCITVSATGRETVHSNH